jgi:hypothetical protein
VKGQTVFGQSLGQHVENPLRVPFSLEDDDCIITVADKDCAADEPWHGLSREPLIQHFVQVDVGDDGRNAATLWAVGFRVLKPPVLHHARLQPLADESQQHSITYPLAHDVTQPTMVQGVEELPDIDLKDSPARYLHRLVTHDSQRLMR